LLVADFLRKNELAKAKGINRVSERALAQLASHTWPGNVRELLNVLERAVLRATGDAIDRVELAAIARPVAITAPRPDGRLPLRAFLQATEREYLVGLLERHHGSIAPAARQADIDQATLHRKMHLHGLCPADYRRNGRHPGPGAK